jgi:exodeoxyribonuclease-5
MAIEWSPQQSAALTKFQQWWEERPSNIFKLFGYAGTGKSTLAKTIGNIVKADGGLCQFAAFTGKAAVVMKKKGCDNARTLHSIIYTSMDKSTDNLDKLTKTLEGTTDAVDKIKLAEAIDGEKKALKQPSFSLKADALTVWDEDDMGFRRPSGTISMFAIDECSMVDERLGADLLSFGCPVVVLGDPAQLPPVMGGGYFTNGTPDVLLTEIHRQAAGSPIITLANNIRKGKPLQFCNEGAARVMAKADVTQDDWMNADQILCGKNETRHAMNRRIRQLKGFSGMLPTPGEKLVCLRNNPKMGLLNGSLWVVKEVDERGGAPTFKLKLESLDEPGNIRFVNAHKAPFLGDEIHPWEAKDADEFNFGYALTVHKSQGSQWDNVVLFNEWNNRQNKQQWLYTGVTRAAERVTVVQP